jgi:AcrR family transcriptional regulator
MARIITERSDTIPLLAEVFRTYGYEGASLSLIGEVTGLGKGSLYHFFPGGKEEMAAAVLADIESWFRVHVFMPLRESENPRRAISEMFASVDNYFEAGGRVCLVGVFALGETRERFAAEVHRYFAEWIAALANALVRLGHTGATARLLAEEAIAGIQGALVLARASSDKQSFLRITQQLERRLLSQVQPD